MTNNSITIPCVPARSWLAWHRASRRTGLSERRDDSWVVRGKKERTILSKLMNQHTNIHTCFHTFIHSCEYTLNRAIGSTCPRPRKIMILESVGVLKFQLTDWTTWIKCDVLATFLRSTKTFSHTKHRTCLPKGICSLHVQLTTTTALYQQCEAINQGHRIWAWTSNANLAQ